MQTVRDLLTYVRESMIDDTGGDVVTGWLEDDSDLLFSNNQLIDYLNSARREFTRRRPIRDASTSSVCAYSVTAGDQPTVDLDDRILRVHSAILASQDGPLIKRYQNNQLEDLDPDWRDYDGTVAEYLEDMEDHQLRLLGTLASDDTLNLVVDRIVLEDVPWAKEVWTADTEVSADDYIRPTADNYNGHYYKCTTGGTTDASEPTWPTDGSTVTDNDVVWEDQGLIGSDNVAEIESYYLEDLADWICHLAYMRRDSEIYDPALSEYYGARFEKRVGPPRSAAQEREWRRTSNLRRRTRKYYR